jgi:TonB family protein
MDGAVAVIVAVTKDGLAADALVVCSNHPAFSAAALLAVKAATFVPATLNGSPVESVATLPIDFHP